MVGRKSPTRETSIREVRTSRPVEGAKLRERKDRTDLKDVCTKIDGGGEPPALSSLSVLHVAPHLQVGRGCSATGTAADSGNVTPQSTVQGTQCPLQSGGEGDTALSDGSQCWIREHILFKKLQECVFLKVLCLVALLVNKLKGLEPRPWAALQPTGQSLVRWCVCDGVYLWGGASNLQSTESCIMLA